MALGLRELIEKVYIEMKAREGKKTCCGYRSRMKRKVRNLYATLQRERNSDKSEFSEEELSQIEEKIKELASIFKVNLGGIQ